MAQVVVNHPLGGLNFEGVRKKVGMAFPDTLKAAQEWQPAGT